MNDWDEIVSAEPRLGDVLDAALADMADDPTLCGEWAYVHAKAGIVALVGWYRGTPQRVKSNIGPNLLSVIAGIGRFDGGEGPLTSHGTYEVAVRHISTKLFEAEDRRDAA